MQFTFLIGTARFNFFAEDSAAAKLKAEVFVDREGLCNDPYGWVPVGPTTFRISVGA